MAGVRLTPSNDEIAFGHGVGFHHATRERCAAARREPDPPSPLEALVDACSVAIGPRTFVEFSGGVDSSLVLAAACEAARRSGRQPPQPITLRYAAASTDEREYQERVIDWLQLSDWTILSVDDELDLIGPASRHDLQTLGLCHAPRVPGRSWWLEPLAKTSAPGATVLNGEGGDEVLGGSPRAALHAVTRAVRTGRHRRQAAAIIRHKATRSRRSNTVHPPWLNARGRAAHTRALRAGAGRSASMSNFLLSYRSANSLVATQHRMAEQARRYGFATRSPLLDHRFLAALHAHVPERDRINRSLLVREHFGGLLPPAVEQRTSKVYFGSAVFNAATRDFAQRWDGRTGVPIDLVDPEVVRTAWMSGNDARSALMLQSAWLATEGAR